jgi:hypothetical protein
MKRIACLLVLLFCLPLSLRADDASKRAKVEEMLGLLHIDRTMDQIMTLLQKQATAATNAQLSSKGASPDQQARADAFQKQLFDYIEEQLSWKSMQTDYVDMYAQTFTEDEIDGMLAFYKSPAGVAVIAKTPELTQKSSTLAQKRLLAVAPQIQKMIQDFASTSAKHSGTAVKSN